MQTPTPDTIFAELTLRELQEIIVALSVKSLEQTPLVERLSALYRTAKPTSPVQIAARALEAAGLEVKIVQHDGVTRLLSRPKLEQEPDLGPPYPMPSTDGSRDFGDIGGTASIENQLRAVIAERNKQIEKGYDDAHDDLHSNGDIFKAGRCYINEAYMKLTNSTTRFTPPLSWPFRATEWKPEIDPHKNAIKGVTMILAELARLERLESVEQAHAAELAQDDANEQAAAGEDRVLPRVLQWTVQFTDELWTVRAERLSHIAGWDTSVSREGDPASVVSGRNLRCADPSDLPTIAQVILTTSLDLAQKMLGASFVTRRTP